MCVTGTAGLRISVFLNISNIQLLNRSKCASFCTSADTKKAKPNRIHQTVFFSGIQPTGVPHIGNYFGFIEQWLKIQQSEPKTSALYLSIADYHAISTGYIDAAKMRENVLKMAAGLLACGVDASRTILFQQSRVLEHANLMYILGSLQTVAQLNRLPQYKDKSKKFKDGAVPINLLIYPLLQTADVLLYKGTHVPVGQDQSQHMHLMSDLADRFNSFCGYNYFPIPIQVTSNHPRIKNLRDPIRKMSKSDVSVMSRIDIDDSKELCLSKCSKALSDFESTITYDPVTRPAVSNLVLLYSAVTRKLPEEIVKESVGLDTKQFKMRLALALEEKFGAIREKYEILANRNIYKVHEVLEHGSNEARKRAAKTLNEVQEMVGLR